MSVKSMSLVVVALFAVCAVPAVAQQSLGDLVAEGGYDWMIGRWAATTDDGQKIEFEYSWGLDKNLVLNDFRMGGYTYHGMIMLASSGVEACDMGADNRGGIWKGTWYDDPDGLIRRTEFTQANGQVYKGEIVHTRVDADRMTVAMYAVDNSGYRTGEPWGKLTYKRQPADAARDSSSGQQGGRATDYQTLGDLVSEAGYGWLIGKWTGSDDERAYELENKPILDKQAALMEVKIGNFKYRGLVMYVPSRQEIMQIGADNMGGSWKSTWDEDYDGPVHKIECTRADGTKRKMEHVYVKVDGDTFKVKEYAVESGGYRASEPGVTITFKRR